MATGRFEKYVRDTIAEGVKARRDKLVKAYEDEAKKVDAKEEALRNAVKDALEDVSSLVDNMAKKWGWKVNESCVNSQAVSISDVYGFSDLYRRYDISNKVYIVDRNRDGRHFYMNGKAGDAYRAIKEFDEEVEKAATRLVVSKMDLGMKVDEFDKLIAEAIAKLMK